MYLKSLSKKIYHFQFKKSTINNLFVSLFIFLLFPHLALAGTGGSEFQPWVETMISYFTGYPAMGLLAISLAVGAVKLAKGEPAIFGWTIVAGIAVASFDTIVNAMVTALI